MHTYRPQVKDETIVSASKDAIYEHEKEDEFYGFELKTNYGQVIRCMIDPTQDCCERADVVSDIDVELVIGKTILLVRYASDDIEIDIGEATDKWDSSPSCATMCIEFTDGSMIHLRAFNIHNGYYPRRYLFQWPNHSDIDKL
jgi:hypothetical protein